MLTRALADMGLEPRLEGSGGGSDANVFFENGIAALPVGIGVRSFHTKEETAMITRGAAGRGNVPASNYRRISDRGLCAV